jgi:glycosyltransferase involved in cell wall biosynthesis
LLGGTYPVPKLSFKFFNLIWRGHYDIVSTQTRFFSLTILGLFYAWIKRIPLIHTERGTRHSVVASKAVNIISQSVDHVAGWLIARKAVHSVGVSYAACEFMRHIGIKNPIRIPNGIDIQQMSWRPNGKRMVCFVGRLIEAKGVQDLIGIWDKIQKQFLHSELVIVGDGAYRVKLEGLALATPSIKFVGLKQPVAVKGILLKSSVFVNPSYSEGLPTSVMEAAALGLPIVATDVGGTRELIADGESGFIIQPGDKEALYDYVTYLLGNPDIAGRFGAKARQNMEQYSWDIIVKQYEGLFSGKQ